MAGEDSVDTYRDWVKEAYRHARSEEEYGPATSAAITLGLGTSKIGKDLSGGIKEFLNGK